MPKLINLFQFTDQGIRNYQGTVERTKNATEAIARMGGKLHSVHWTLGEYDVVALIEFPDDDTAAAFSLKLGALGNSRVTTLRAFDQGEMEKIIATASR
jgi:uncharacterized protein with GYD domain